MVDKLYLVTSGDQSEFVSRPTITKCVLPRGFQTDIQTCSIHDCFDDLNAVVTEEDNGIDRWHFALQSKLGQCYFVVEVRG
ncbi:hypothetical protein GLAREA_05853 [Glarea lozoyensis ATCC 20868]|uniref:Uncharacterized protein n=1 Tax=Glarea lozoyensis (strain ATCC 20868 / MF5171) TaxID=1116229 RepID=S3DLD8_GLAL2|nr:uncharacterized protein GLAREA_05853 [Glarea lozoyensis ATCC 20868]EPE32841.1 hypothetical protein GLAREA_05853 [Glarea lozoyensis ATCC 20868]